MTKSRGFKNLILGTILVIAVLVWIAVFQTSGQQENLKVVFCDVGQGDSELIVSPTSQELLIDGGPSDAVLSCLGEELPFFDKSIKYLIITHPDADHITGLVEVLKRYQVEHIFYTRVNHDSKIYRELLVEIEKQNIPTKLARVGDLIDLGAGVKIQILHPFEILKDIDVENSNNTSIVSRLSYGNFSVLFPGDLETEGQKDLLAHSSGGFQSLIFQVPHHGSKNFWPEFYERVSAQIAVISVGANNRYGHPSRDSSEKLDELGLRVLRTDKEGTIRFFSDGKKWWQD